MDPFEVGLLKDLLVSLFEPCELNKILNCEDFRPIRFPNGLELYVRGQSNKFHIISNRDPDVPSTYLLSLEQIGLQSMFRDYRLARQPSLEVTKNGQTTVDLCFD